MNEKLTTIQTQDPVFRDQPITSITKLVTLRASSPDRFPDIKNIPTFVNPTTKKTYHPIVGRILSRATIRIYRLKDEEGNIDWTAPPLCYSDDGKGEVPSKDLPDPNSEKCVEWVRTKGRTIRQVVCEFAKWNKTKPDLKKPDIPPECTKIIYFLILPEGASVPMWIYFDKVALSGAKRFLSEFGKLMHEIQGSKAWDYVVEISLRKETIGGRNPVYSDFKIVGQDEHTGGYNPKEKIHTIMNDLQENSPNLLLPTISGVVVNFNANEESEE